MTNILKINSDSSLTKTNCNMQKQPNASTKRFQLPWSKGTKTRKDQSYRSCGTSLSKNLDRSCRRKRASSAASLHLLGKKDRRLISRM